MPTAVERFFQEFLKLDIASGREQRDLNAAFANLDSDLLKLQNPDLSQGAFLKLEERFEADFHKIGGAYFETGEDLGQLARFALGVDAFVIKLTNPTAPAAAAVAGGSLQDAFLKLDSALATSGSDLKIFGGDFLKIDNSAGLAEFTLKWRAAGGDATKLSTDMLADQSTIADFLKIDGESTSQDHKISVALSAALKIVSDDFGALAVDFTKLSDALTGGGGGAGGKLNSPDLISLLGPPGSAFSATNSDFLKLSADLSAVAGPAATEITALLKHAFGGGGGAG